MFLKITINFIGQSSSTLTDKFIQVFNFKMQKIKIKVIFVADCAQNE